MKEIVDNPFLEPFVGNLVEEQCSVGQLCDNRFYLLSSEEDSPLVKKAFEAMEVFHQRILDENLFRRYDLQVKDCIELANHPKLKERICSSGDNLLLQLETPLETHKRFLITKTDETNVFRDISLLVHASERIAKDQNARLLKKFALANPEEFGNICRNALEDKRFFAEYFISRMGDMMDATYKMATSMSSIKERLNIEGTITHQNKLMFFDRLQTNLRTYRKRPTPEVEAELECVFRSIDPATLIHFAMNQSPAIQEKFCDYINPVRRAQTSTMDVEVRRYNEIDRTMKNDGYYRVFLKKKDECVMVHFRRKGACILYLIYLLDRKKRGDQVDTLNLKRYKKLFLDLYRLVYQADGESVFINMMKDFNDNNEVVKKGLYILLEVAREDVGMSCERMLEPAEPFILDSPSSHLTVLPDHILVPDELLALF